METQTGASIGSSEAWFQHLAGQKPGQKRGLFSPMWDESHRFYSYQLLPLEPLSSKAHVISRCSADEWSAKRGRLDLHMIEASWGARMRPSDPLGSHKGPGCLLVWERRQPAAAGVCHQLPRWKCSGENGEHLWDIMRSCIHHRWSRLRS